MAIFLRRSSRLLRSMPPRNNLPIFPPYYSTGSSKPSVPTPPTPSSSTNTNGEISESHRHGPGNGTETSPKSGIGARFGAAIRNSLSDLTAVPPSALGLGLAGAIPFVALTPPFSYFIQLPEIMQGASYLDAQAAYGAVILSFLGGPYWGLAMAGYTTNPDSRHPFFTKYTLRYVWSVVPSLLAWPSLLLVPEYKFGALIVSYGLVVGVDAVFTKMKLVPAWYLPLRVLLSLIAMLSMGSSLLFVVARKSISHSRKFLEEDLKLDLQEEKEKHKQT